MRVFSRVVFAALITAPCSCLRPVRPEPPREIQAYAGVPVTFETADSARGGEYEWAFGEEPSAMRGPRASRAWARSGRYEVRALQRGQLAATFRVSVLPRPVLHAVPPGAEVVLFVPRTQDLRTATEFARRAIGPIVSDEVADRVPFLRYALSAEGGVSPAELGLDEEEGLAAFRLNEDEWMAAVGTVDDPKALASARRLFEERGFRAREGPDTSLILSRDADAFVAVVDRGYLYFSRVEGGVDPLGRISAVRRQLASLPAEGLAREPLLSEMQRQVGEGHAMVFWRQSGRAHGIHGGLAAVRFDGDAMDLDGRVRADRPLWDAARAPKGVPLERGAEGPVVALSASVAPEDLARLLRVRSSAKELDDAARVLQGDFALAGYFDARATARGMKGAVPNPSAIAGTLIAHAGIRDRAAAERLVERALEEHRMPFKRRPARDATAFVLDWAGRQTSIEVTDRRISLEAGEPLRERQGVELAEKLRSRFVPTAFGEGHVSLVVDVGQVARELEPSLFRGAGQAAMLGLLSVFLRQATSVDTIFLDLEPDQSGGRLRGRVTVRPR